MSRHLQRGTLREQAVCELLPAPAQDTRGMGAGGRAVVKELAGQDPGQWCKHQLMSDLQQVGCCKYCWNWHAQPGGSFMPAFRFRPFPSAFPTSLLACHNWLATMHSQIPTAPVRPYTQHCLRLHLLWCRRLRGNKGGGLHAAGAICLHEVELPPLAQLLPVAHIHPQLLQAGTPRRADCMLACSQGVGVSRLPGGSTQRRSRSEQQQQEVELEQGWQ